MTGEGARSEREGSLSEICQNEVHRVYPHAALLRREEHRVIHAAARAQSHRNAREDRNAREGGELPF